MSSAQYAGTPAARRRRTPHLPARLLAVPLTVVAVVGGVWFTGGVVTNDFALAMRLSAAWMALAGLLALAVGFRSRAFRWPVLGAYAVTAAVLGVYLGSSMFFDDVVDERVATAAPRLSGTAAAGNVRLAAGGFQSVRHEASGRATAIELAGGGRVLTLTNFDVDNGPDLRVYLVAGRATSEEEVDDVVDLGALKGNKGNQQYEVPVGVDLGRYATVVIWCRAFSVLFARAPLAA